ncbi:MAG: 2-dehydropantoate 2-reductase N-terminal domain-containing protein, partial [Pseudomonadota bacterium]
MSDESLQGGDMQEGGAAAEPFEHCFVMGAGSWGTALAIHLARAGRQVTLWMRSPDLAEQINADRRNDIYLPDVKLPDNIDATADPTAIGNADAALCVIPSQHMRGLLPSFAAATGDRPLPVALCSKGIERSTGLLMHDVLADVWPTAKGAVLSGPSFASDV